MNQRVRDREHHHRERDGHSHHRESHRDRDSHHRDRHNNNTTRPFTNSSTLHHAIQDIVKLCIEEESFYLGKETGRLMRWGELEGLGALEDVPQDFQIVDAPGVDIFGESLVKKHNFECECPRCHRTLAAQRFAPHLEKCMGMGRNSSRIASKRLAQGSSREGSQNGNGSTCSSQGSEKVSSQGSSTSGPVATGHGHTHNGELQSEEEHFEEDEDDEDWTMERKRKHTKKPIEKISPKRFAYF